MNFNRIILLTELTKFSDLCSYTIHLKAIKQKINDGFELWNVNGEIWPFHLQSDLRCKYRQVVNRFAPPIRK